MTLATRKELLLANRHLFTLKKWKVRKWVTGSDRTDIGRESKQIATYKNWFPHRRHPYNSGDDGSLVILESVVQLYCVLKNGYPPVTSTTYPETSICYIRKKFIKTSTFSDQFNKLRLTKKWNGCVPIKKTLLFVPYFNHPCSFMVYQYLFGVVLF